MSQTAREIFTKIMSFEPCERTLNWEFAYWGGALKKWYEEGLPKIKGLPADVTFGEGIRGPGSPLGSPSYSGELPIWDYDVSSYFSFDEGIKTIPYDFWMNPKFEKKIICEDDRFIEVLGTDGVRKKCFRDNSSPAMPIDWPVKDRGDWEKLKEERFNIDSISIAGRFYGDFDKFKDAAKNRSFPLCIFDPPVGFFNVLRQLIGEKSLYMLYYDDPGLISDILSHLCSFWINIAEELTSVIDFDLASFAEDMAGRQGMLISPATFKQFMSPCYKKITDFLKSKGINIFIVDSDGNIEELIPLFMEAGVGCIFPMEKQAGNDLIAIRKNYPSFAMMGGFDKNTLYKGKQYIDKELEKMPYLISQGGYIPFSDHDVPPNALWENYKYYRNRLSDIIFSTRVRNF